MIVDEFVGGDHPWIASLAGLNIRFLSCQAHHLVVLAVFLVE